MASQAPAFISVEKHVFPAILPGASQQIVIGEESASGALGAGTSVIRLYSTSDCYVKLAATGLTATTGDMFLPSGHIECFGIPAGHDIAVLQASASGTLYVTEGA